MVAYAVLAGGTSSTGNVQQVSGLGSAGQVLTSAGAAALPVWASPPIADLPWTVVTAATQAISNDNGYISNAASGAVTYTLPATATVGQIIRITGLQGASGWILSQNALQSIQLGTAVTTIGTGGSLASTANADGIHLVCAIANTTWVLLSSVGNITYV